MELTKYYVMYWNDREDYPVAVFEVLAKSQDEAEEIAYENGGDYYEDDWPILTETDEWMTEEKKEEYKNQEWKTNYYDLVELCKPGWHFKSEEIVYKKSKNKNAEIRFWSNEGDGCSCYHYIGAYVYWKDRSPYLIDLSYLEPEELAYLNEQVNSLKLKEVK